MKKGWIFLDIDGTITTKGKPLHPSMIACLESIYKKGWNVAFITGRTFSFAHMALEKIPFPYFLGVQNGADLLSMPERKLVSRAYLNDSVINEIEEICHELDEDFLIYTGYDKGDFCYYRPDLFSKDLLEYIELLKTLSKESWQAVKAFPKEQLRSFPLIKCFGSKQQMEEIGMALKDHPTIESALIKDPMIDGLYLQLLTHRQATKGNTLKRCVGDSGLFSIAAGDDWNDYSMLKEADRAIVIEGAPEELLQLADIVAKPLTEFGIIEALEQATKRVD